MTEVASQLPLVANILITLIDPTITRQVLIHVGDAGHD